MQLQIGSSVQSSNIKSKDGHNDSQPSFRRGQEGIGRSLEGMTIKRKLLKNTSPNSR